MKKGILSFVTGLSLGLTQIGGAWGQTHKVEAKPETVVRAIGVYEWTGDLAKPAGSRFMPVTVFIDGDLEDAGLYKPQPVPFALLSGNVYELEDAGQAKGTLVLESALHAKLPDGAPGPAFDEGWMAYGSFKPLEAPRPKKTATLKPSKNLPVIQVSGGDSSKPHLSDKTGDAAGKGADPAQSKQGSGSPQSSQGSKPASDAKDDPAPTTPDPDRPTMHRRSTDDDTASSGAGNDSGKTTSSNDDAERPTLKRRSPEEAKQQKKKGETATVTGGDSLNDDPDRPRLHHGSNEGKGDNEPPKLMGVPKDMHQMVAVSDAKNRDPHVFARPWEDPNERAGVLAKMQGFARAKLAEYGVVPGVTPPTAIAGATLAASGSSTGAAAGTAPDSGPPTLKRGIPSKASVTTETAPAASGASTGAAASTAPDSGPPTLKRGIPSKASVTTEAKPAASAAKASSATKPGASKTAAKSRHGGVAAPAQITLADEDLKGYTLSYGGAATYVYQAHTVETGSVMRYVTVVAQDNGMGELKVALASATDAAHLDRTPWMRLIGPVDVEASNRASLLFELRGQSARQFGLYRVIAARPEQIFLTGSGL
jgi:hypothetical protein